MNLLLLAVNEGPKDLLPRRPEWESIYWWRRQQADYVHVQDRYCAIRFLRLDAPSCRTTEEPWLLHLGGRQGNV